MKPIHIVDTTLRDGNIALDFSFTAKDTEDICASLENAKISYIEIGYGFGLRGQAMTKAAAAEGAKFIRFGVTAVCKYITSGRLYQES